MHDSRMGRFVGGYEIVGKLGAGAMGEVYLGEDRALHRKVALKFLSIHDAEQKERFLREGKAIAALEGHPNICNIYHLLEENTDSILVMEYIPGRH